MKTGYKTSKAPYEDIHFGDMVQRYAGEPMARVVWRPFGVKLKELKYKGGFAYPITKVDKIIYRKVKR